MLNQYADASREIFWNLDSPFNKLLMYMLFALSMFVCGYGLRRRFSLWRSGGGTFTMPALEDLRRFIQDAVRQGAVNAEQQARIFHSLIYVGFIVLLITTTAVLIDYDLHLPIYRGGVYLLLTVASDLFGLGLIIGVAIAAARRFRRIDKLHNNPAAYLVLFLLALMAVQGFLLESLRIAATSDPWALFSIVGYSVSLLFTGFSLDVLRSLHFLLWWFHTITVFVFIALIPYTKFLHIITSPANILVKPKRTPGAMLFPGDIEELAAAAETDPAAEFRIGVQSAGDLSWKRRLDLDACTECGRCQDVCPAYNSGKALSPKWVILDSRDHLLTTWADGALESTENNASWTAPLDNLDRTLIRRIFLPVERPEARAKTDPCYRASNQLTRQSALGVGSSPQAKLGGEVIAEQVFWDCTTCGACVEACPVAIDQLDLIYEVRRSMALMEGNIPAETQSCLRGIENRGNPFGPAEDRANWTAGLDVRVIEPGEAVEVLYWVGCISSYDLRKQKIARAIARILNAAGEDWGILGNRERCTGDPARRIGEENIFQSAAKANIETLNSVRFSILLANCPHCFNTIKNEYRRIKGYGRLADIEVVHHSSFIKKLLDEGRIRIKRSAGAGFSYHDPCYLGRHNGIYDAPRTLIAVSQAGEPLELKDNRERAMCCGAGGGHFWMDERDGERINLIRFRQAESAGSSTVGTACPFCLHMLEDGAKLAGNESARVQDIAEIVAERLEL